MKIIRAKFLNVRYFILVSALIGTIIFVALAKNTTPPPASPIKNPRLVVKKADRLLELYDGETLVKTYRVSLGFAPIGDKEKQGEGKTPEGDFYSFTRNQK